ncbi:hypothetical protein TNCV_2317461 [Trichonephila clavipes]|nr:hypothetical protein TNCV_2317461 [Trichonephila clavipes]
MFWENEVPGLRQQSSVLYLEMRIVVLKTWLGDRRRSFGQSGPMGRLCQESFNKYAVPHFPPQVETDKRKSIVSQGSRCEYTAAIRGIKSAKFAIGPRNTAFLR